ncbi:hypothetical protein PUR61_03265 [Streptomyces sp. BE20]|uniref:hypothetical protein n=1 Tax=Streptomyces sp. BE20 TaxID=3002525 RepID=UPI002E77E61E|nr:hypothetical protein [Streptomyces sp. BE20]MEE1821222.1 hypothetical protein [Streptomyces sp. BE20]
MLATRLTDAALRVLATTASAWEATTPLRQRAATTWRTRTSPAQRAGQITATALAAVLVASLTITLVTTALRLAAAAVADLARGCAQAAAYLWHSDTADGIRDVLQVPLGAVAAWLRQNAAGLPATPGQVGGAALVLALVLFVAARRGSTAARAGWALLGAAACAATWQTGPGSGRTAAAAITAGVWLLFAPAAYAGRWWKTERRTRLLLSPAVEEALAQLAAVHTRPDTTPAPASQPAARPAPLPRLSPLKNLAALKAPSLAAGGFRCRHCDQPLAWAATEDDPERTWRTPDGTTTCPGAPTTPALHHAL